MLFTLRWSNTKQHFCPTCSAILLLCRLGREVARIATYSKNLSHNKIHCCKLSGDVAESRLGFYFSQQKFVLLCILPSSPQPVTQPSTKQMPVIGSPKLMSENWACAPNQIKTNNMAELQEDCENYKNICPAGLEKNLSYEKKYSSWRFENISLSVGYLQNWII